MADAGQRPTLWLLNGLAGPGLLFVFLLLIAVRAFAGGVTLAWDPVNSPSLVGYMVYYGPAAGSYTSSIDVGNTTSYTVSGLIEGTTYHFAATAYDAGHTQSGYSNDVPATVPYSAPVAQFSASTTSGTAPLALNFLNTSTGTITTYAWTFGDGGTSSTQSPAHVYSLAGVYTVSLTVTGPGGSNTKTNSNYITVSAAAHPTTTTVSSALNPSVVGTSVTFTATVTGTAPTGSVAFTDGGATITGCGAVTLPAGTANSKTATCNSASLTVGTHNIVATYGGDGGNNASTSSPLTQTVNKSTSTATLVSSANPSVVGTSVTFTATVTGTVPTGSVAFTDGGSAISGCSAVALPAGAASTKTATCSSASLTVGTHNIVATYGGDGGNNASTSTTVAQGVNPASSGAALVSSVNPSVVGTNVTFTATVTGTAPTGSVAFTDGGSAISGCSAVGLPAGAASTKTATCSTSSLTSGAHNIVASYSGDSGNNASTSSPLSQTVNKATSTATLASSANPSVVGTNVTFTAAVTPVAGGGTPTGTVTFKDGTTTIGSGALNAGGVATLLTSALTAGTHSITAAYGGDAALKPSTSTVMIQVIAVDPTCSGNSATNASLVEHYYTTILRRPSDAGGKASWMSEADRLCALGADPRQTFVAMANVFFNTPEYAALNRDNDGFVADLYSAFFSQLPDAAGLSYWVGQLASGMPRDNVMNSFLFSPEFTATMNAAFPGQTARAETYLVLNLYGGLLRRLPETGGYTYWTGQFRTAECNSSAAAAVQAAIDSVSSQFVASTEYAARATSNNQYVDDLYYALMQRGAETAGYNYWLGQLNGGLLTRAQIRQQFLTSPEMLAQSAAVAAQGCSP